MKYIAKACTSKKYRGINKLIIGFVGLLSCFGTAMAVYELISAKYLFAASYFIAAFLGFTYVIIRVNTVFATYITVDAQNISMKNWSNDFLPYMADSRLRLINEFVPAKTKITEIPIREITKIMIGTKNFIKRNSAENSSFRERIKDFETSRDRYMKKVISSMDIFYVESRGGDSYMPIDRFEKADIVKVVNNLQKRNEAIELHINSRDYRSLRPRQIPTEKRK